MKSFLDGKKGFTEVKSQNGEFMTHKLKHTENSFSRPGGRALEAKEAEGAPQVEAGRRLEELRRRRGETESEEFEKLRQKQQEAALELEELKKKREERRKVLEEEEQRRKQEEAERKAREEVSGARAPQRAPAPERASLGAPLARASLLPGLKCCYSLEHRLLQMLFKDNKLTVC